MNAIQFIKENGVEKAREVVEGAPDGATHLSNDACHYVNADFKPLPAHIKEQLPKLIVIEHLKRLVESIRLVNKLGGIAIAKEKLAYGNSISAMRLSYETTITNRDGTKQNVITGVYLEDLEQAIADYESIYGGEHV
ncbi:hypothetical protein EJP75_08505 [Acinetobacter baumannii]|nr:hypothetical protein EJP75_08505 [Acinetobacter baumannii]